MFRKSTESFLEAFEKKVSTQKQEEEIKPKQGWNMLIEHHVLS